MNLEIKVNFVQGGDLKRVVDQQVRSLQGGGRGRGGSGGGVTVAGIASEQEIKRAAAVAETVTIQAQTSLQRRTLSLMSRQAIAQGRATSIIPPTVAEENAKSYASAFNRVLAAEIAAGASKLGLPMQATWGLRSLLSSGAISPMAIGAVGVGLAGVGAGYAANRYIMNERQNASSFISAGARYNGAGDVGGLLSSASRGGYAGNGFFQPLIEGISFGLYGKLQGRSSASSALGNLSGLGLRAEQLTSVLSLTKATTKISDISQSDLTKEIGELVAQVPLRMRNELAKEISTLQYYSARVAKDSKDTFAAGIVGESSSRVNSLLGQGRMDVFNEQLRISSRTAENYDKIERSSGRAIAGISASGIAAQGSAQVGLIGATNPDQIFNIRREAIAKSADFEMQKNRELVREKRRESLQATRDVHEREKELLKATGKATIAEAMGVSGAPDIAAAQQRYQEALKREEEAKRAVRNARADATNSNKTIIAQREADLAIAEAEKKRSESLIRSDYAGLQGQSLGQQINIAGGARGVSRLSRAIGSFSDVAISREVLEKQISEAQGRGDTVTRDALYLQRGVLRQRGAMAEEDVYFEAGRSRRDLQAERRQARLDARQIRRGERRLRDEYGEDVRTRRTGGSFEEWLQGRQNKGSEAGPVNDAFQEIVKSATEAAGALSRLTNSAKGRGGSPRQTSPLGE